MAIQFGTKQLKNPTPSSVGNVIQVFTVVAACVLAWIGTASFIPAGPSTVIQSILGLLIGVSNGLKPFFGVNVPAGEVDSKNVTAIDSQPYSAPGDQELQNK